MTEFSVEGLTYTSAVELVEKLTLQGIDAHITSGGISIYPKAEQVQIMQALCKVFNAHVHEGETTQGALMEKREERISFQEAERLSKTDRQTENRVLFNCLSNVLDSYLQQLTDAEDSGELGN